MGYARGYCRSFLRSPPSFFATSRGSVPIRKTPSRGTCSVCQILYMGRSCCSLSSMVQLEGYLEGSQSSQAQSVSSCLSDHVIASRSGRCPYGKVIGTETLPVYYATPWHAAMLALRQAQGSHAARPRLRFIGAPPVERYHEDDGVDRRRLMLVVSPTRWRAPALPSGPCTKAAERRGSFRARAYGQGVAIATWTAYGLHARRAAAACLPLAGRTLFSPQFSPFGNPLSRLRRPARTRGDPPFQKGIHQRGWQGQPLSAGSFARPLQLFGL